MKFTEYFNFTRLRSDRAYIKMEWIEPAFNKPDFEETQTDRRIRKWVYINEVNKYLRIVVLDDNQSIHNAFLDRSYKIKEGEL